MWVSEVMRDRISPSPPNFKKRKPMILLNKVGWLRFLASEKCPHGTAFGLARLFGAFMQRAHVRASSVSNC
jgi:hypothetical protein